MNIRFHIFYGLILQFYPHPGLPPFRDIHLIEKAENLGVGLLSVEVLFRLVEKKLLGESINFEEIIKKITMTRGVIQFQ